MLNIQAQRKVQFATVERSNAWVVLAFLTEIQNGETVIVSEPKVVKVILKHSPQLPSGKKSQTTLLALPAPVSLEKTIELPIVSPFVSAIFGFSNSDVVIGLAARPPTVA
jgi:hypothetical protein